MSEASLNRRLGFVAVILPLVAAGVIVVGSTTLQADGCTAAPDYCCKTSGGHTYGWEAGTCDLNTCSSGRRYCIQGQGGANAVPADCCQTNCQEECSGEGLP